MFFNKNNLLKKKKMAEFMDWSLSIQASHEQNGQ